MNFNLKLLKSIFCILSVLIFSFTYAETIELLQKNASVAYEKMMEAKQTAESLAKDATFAEKKLVSAKQKMMEAEREAETAKRKSEQAKIAMEQAINRWKQASDTLANEWGTSEVK
ncbi:MAG: hypothetical protein EBU46_05710 [Nitrosomonadaceae bacterium]|nr:hypothetical protein [Nitrosomonadaceae bacterium]